MSRLPRYPETQAEAVLWQIEDARRSLLGTAFPSASDRPEWETQVLGHLDAARGLLTAKIGASRRHARRGPDPRLSSLVYADPPWKMKYRSASKGKSAANTHPVMTLRDICETGEELRPTLADDAFLALWVIDPMLPQGDRVAEAWGFPEKVCRLVCWAKLTPRGKQWHVGTGYHTRANPEDLILYRRGRGLPVQKKGKPHRLQVHPCVRPISTKPDAIRTLLETIYPAAVNRLELFARREYEGWTCFGNEISGRDIREDLRAYALKLGVS